MSETKTILLVDDDPDVLFQQQAMVKAAGYETLTAASGEEAEALLKEKRPDLAIVDLMMEQPDAGFTLCYHLKKLSPPVPVIVVTSVAREAGIEFDVATEEERSWIKADAFLDKPVRSEQLQQEIERLLEE